jgi:hypothetical protein
MVKVELLQVVQGSNPNTTSLQIASYAQNKIGVALESIHS